MIGKLVRMRLDDIVRHHLVQPRAALKRDALGDYTELLNEGGEFDDPMIVYRLPDGTHVLADGFHRYESYRAAGRAEADVEVRAGTLRDAFYAGYDVNARRGVRLDRADKHRSVRLALGHDPDWSDARIAERLGVSAPFVGAVRKALAAQPDAPPPPATRVGRDGRSYQTPAPRPAPAPAPTVTGSFDAKIDRTAPPAAVPHFEPNPPDDDDDDDDGEVRVVASPEGCREAIRLALRRVRGVRRVLAAVMATPFADEVRRVARASAAWGVYATGDLAVDGRHGATPYGAAEFSLPALDDLGAFFGALAVAFGRLADKELRLPGGATGPLDLADETADGEAHDF